MIIGIDAHVFTGIFQGSRTYLYNLYRSVLELDRQNEYNVFGHWEGLTPFGKEVQHTDFLSHSRWKRLTYQTAPLIKRFHVDLYHSTFISPLILPCNSLLTILDVLYETHPQYFELKQGLRNKLLVRHSAGKAVQVHTISEFCRQSIIDVYGMPPELVKVVPCGVDLDRFTPLNRTAAVESVFAKFGIKNYILSVGRLEPRKNHAGLLRAYAILRKKLPDVGPLIIVGQKDFGYQELFKALEDLQLQESVHILNNIEDALLPTVYRAAKLFVYPSFAEGFGIPPLEAMASGVPVVSSNTTAMPEIVGAAGLLIDPESIEEISAAMYQVLTNQDLADRLSSLGRHKAEKYSWKNAAECYLEAIKSIGMDKHDK